MAHGEARSRRSEARVACAVVAVALALRLVLAWLLPLLEVEAYYWTWSRQLDQGFHDHPPGVALLIRLGTSLLGHGPLGVRAGSLLLTTVGALAYWRFCRASVGPRAALAALTLASFAPFWFPFGVVASPDGPMLALWVLALLCFRAALRGSSSLPWLATGACTGLAFLGKYNAAQLPLVFGLFLALTPGGRAWLRRPGPWLGLGLALALVLPNLLWNGEHGHSSLGIAFREGLEPGAAARHLTLLLLLPLVHLTPGVGWAWYREVWAWARSGDRAQDPERLLLVLGSAVPLLLFAGVACLTQVHAHWVASALLCGAPLALRGLDGPDAGVVSPSSLRRALVGAAVMLAMLAALPLALGPLARSGWRPAERGLVELTGWEELQQRLDTELVGRDQAMLSSMNFHLVSRMVWMTGGAHDGLPLRLSHRHQFRLWLDESDLGRDALYVAKADLDEPAVAIALKLGRWFERTEPLEPVWVEGLEGPARRFELVWCEGLKSLR
jgi:4-amino-4-deoxy-L-arabinose transferase-like glycosyltransferase